jgi:multiple sugar transport system ATP-binding protein
VPAIVLDRVAKVYDGDVRAVDEVSLEVADGELLVLLGPSGCGKTTLLRMMAGLEDITSGELWLEGQRATQMEPGDRNVAMVFQHSALYPHLTVRENLAFPLITAGGLSRHAVDARVMEMAYGLGLDDQLDRKPGTLSGGERQRVAMGRALILQGPTVLLMDEPLASLDVGLRTGLRSEIGAIIRAMRLTTVYVTHDQAEALSLADRIAILRDGVVEDHGPPMRVYTDPATAFVAAFLGSPQINLTRATVEVREGERIVLDFTAQRIDLPWSDPRRPALARYDGQEVVIGIRPDALTPVQDGAPAPDPAGQAGLRSVFRGRVAALEYYGHEWLARVDAGLRLVDLDTVRGRPGPVELAVGTAAGPSAQPAAIAGDLASPGSPAASAAVGGPASPPGDGSGRGDGSGPDDEGGRSAESGRDGAAEQASLDGQGDAAVAGRGGRRIGLLRRRRTRDADVAADPARDPARDPGTGTPEAGPAADRSDHGDHGGHVGSHRSGSAGDSVTGRAEGAGDGVRDAAGAAQGGGQRAGGHRGASLLVRLSEPRDWAAGREVSVIADISRILIFDSCGRRIGPPR